MNDTLVEQLKEQGFDLSTTDRVACSQCEAICINNVACHEHGCPNKKKRIKNEDD